MSRVARGAESSAGGRRPGRRIRDQAEAALASGRADGGSQREDRVGRHHRAGGSKEELSREELGGGGQ